MAKAGGIVALIASIISVGMALVTLLIGGLGGAFEAEGAGTVVGLGWAGLLLSFVLIVLSAIAMTSPSRRIGVGIIVLSLITAVVGGTLVAIFMILTLLGGVLVFAGSRRRPDVEIP